MRETSSQPKTADGDASRRVLGEGEPLPTAVRGRMETAFGQSLSSVQLHRGPEAAGAADRIGARAFAGDDHIGFAAGEYRPGSLRGDAILAHELAHTLQRRGGSLGGSGAAEGHADRVALKVVSSLGHALPVLSPSAVRAHQEAQGQTPEAVEHGGLRLQRCSRSSSPVPSDAGPSDAGPSDAGPQQQPAPPAPAPVDPRQQALQRVQAVRSPTIQKLEREIQGTWTGELSSRLKKRNSQIDATLALVRDGDQQRYSVLAAMRNRFATLQAQLADGGFEPRRGALNGDIGALADADVADVRRAQVPKGASKPFLEEAVTKLRASINGFLQRRRKLAEEDVDFHRFDQFFVAPDVMGFLAGLPQQPDFTPADLKAMLGNETGDYSNTNIAGLEKTTGVTGGPENPSFVGVGQIGTDAMSSLRANAPRLGLALPARGDPRGNPQQGILLAAAYLRLTADTLARRLPPPVPTGTEFKKMLMAAYNGGPGHVVAMANGYRAEVPGTDPYGWNDIKDQGKLPKPTARKDYRKEMKNYVQGWEDRVAP